MKANTAAKKSTRPAEGTRAAEGPQQVYSALHCLLHSMQALSCHEDQLCSILHEVQRSGRFGARLNADLGAALDEMPAQAFLDDLRELRMALEQMTETRAA